MKKLYESPKAEVVCYSAPDITNAITIASTVGNLGTPGTGAGTGVPSVVQFSKLHE